jgi:hypothetical protein
MYTSRDTVYTFNDIHIYGQILNRWVNLSYFVLEGRGIEGPGLETGDVFSTPKSVKIQLSKLVI